MERKKWSLDAAQEYYWLKMIDENLLGRITANSEIFGGKPIIRGLRISVELILSLLAQGETHETILADYPELEPDAPVGRQNLYSSVRFRSPPPKTQQSQ